MRASDGLERRIIQMSYCRLGEDSDVYVYLSTDNHLHCCGCLLKGEFRTDRYSAMLDYLGEHRALGHRIPSDAVEKLARGGTL